MRHNKKRNAAIIYEQLVRFISKALVDGNVSGAKEAMSIVQEHFKPGTHLHKEFRLFNALIRTTVDSESLATRILDEAKKAARQHDAVSLDKEKGILIRSINKKLGYSNFFEQRIPDYRSLATVQTLLNDWREEFSPDIRRISEYESKVIQMLTEKKQAPEIQKNGHVSNLSVNIMKKKISEKMSRELTNEQFKIIKLSISGDKEKLVPILERTKRDALENIDTFSRINENKVLSEKMGEVKERIASLSTEDLSEENISRFLLINKMVEEIRGDENGN